MKIISVISFLFLMPFPCESSDSWKSVLKEGHGQMTVYFHPDQLPNDGPRDIMDLFEEDLIAAFATYLEQEYEVKLNVVWNNVSSFDTVLSLIESGSHGVFGASTISRTEERSRRFNFAAPYLADVQVIVSNNAFKLANTEEQLRELLKGKTAISIPNTTLEKALLDLKSSLNIEFEIQYVSNVALLLESLANNPEAFGYVDLVNFLVSFENLEDLKRQLFFPIRLDGLGLIYPSSSDWDVVIKKYFSSDQFEKDKERISKKYLGEEVGKVMNQMTNSSEFGLYEEIMISTREKEIQYQELLNSIEREHADHRMREFLIIVLAILGLVGFTLLISNRVKTRANSQLIKQQDTIEQRNSELKKLNDEKNELIRVLAHDLRSPLSNIQGCSLILGEDKNLNDDSKKMVDIINDGSNRIKSMVSKILDVDAIESGDRNVQLEVISPMLVIKEVVHQSLDKARKKSIKTIFKGGEEFKVYADRFYLAQVFENLYQNALKFSSYDSNVIFNVEKRRKWVRITIQDYGPGFTEEDKKQMYQKFAQMSAKPTGGEESVGLGLSIVKKYTELMKGKISFESTPGEGASFFIDLKEA